MAFCQHCGFSTNGSFNGDRNCRENGKSHKFVSFTRPANTYVDRSKSASTQSAPSPSSPANLASAISGIVSKPMESSLPSPADLASAVSEIVSKHMDRRFQNILAKLQEPKNLLPPETVGAQLFASIRERGRNLQFRMEGFPVLTPEQARAVPKHAEHELVAYMISYLEKIFAGCAVVISDNYWLYTGLGCLPEKPDLFICPKSHYTASSGEKPPACRYGTIKDRRLYDAVILVETCLACDYHAFGQLSALLEHLGDKQPDRIMHGMLLSPYEFCLYSQVRQVPFKFMGGNLTDPGSFNAIQEFFKDILDEWRSIDQLCSKLNVIPADPRVVPGLRTGYLGSGAFGRAIVVLPNSPLVSAVSSSSSEFSCESSSSSASQPPTLLAMKIVKDILGIGENINSCREEYLRMKMYHDMCKSKCQCDLIAAPVSTFEELSDELCGYVMHPVGSFACTAQRLRQRNAVPNLHDVLLALYKLHTHDPPMYHGDARLANLIWCPDSSNKLVWIDLRTSVFSSEASSMNFSIDMLTLVDSIVPHLEDAESDILIDKYAQRPSLQTLYCLENYLRRWIRPEDGLDIELEQKQEKEEEEEEDLHKRRAGGAYPALKRVKVDHTHTVQPVEQEGLTDGGDSAGAGVEVMPSSV